MMMMESTPREALYEHHKQEHPPKPRSRSTLTPLIGVTILLKRTDGFAVSRTRHTKSKAPMKEKEVNKDEGQAQQENKKEAPDQDIKVEEGSASGASGGSPKEQQKPAAAKPNSGQKPPQQPSQQPAPPQHVIPGPGAVPIQPYGYPPPYPYYPPIPGYAPSLAGPPGADSFPMMGTSSPYGYTDVSTLVDPPPDTRRNRGGVTEPFPEKLHRMLDAAEKERVTDVVSFFSHGRAFAIHKPRRFVQEIMGRFFRQSRLTSFQRQLNLYGFRRISQGPDNGGYYHELFLKGRPGLSVNMKRTKVKGKAKIRRDPDSEPNFYSYPPLPAQPATAPAPSQQPHSTYAPMPTGPPPAQSPYPAYAYPPPYGYPPMATASPYTAAQQTTGAAPPYPYPYPYGYPWYPAPPHPGMMASPTATTPQTSPTKSKEPRTPQGGEAASTPVAPPPTKAPETPPSATSTLETTTGVKV